MKIWKRFLMPFVLATTLFAVAPQTADAGLISRDQEIALGQQAAQQLEAQYGVLNDPYLTDRINTIGQRLAAVSGRTDITYQFKVLSTNDINAVACPGGFIYVYKGLIDYMPTDAELAGVIGHEVGHVAKKHSVHSIEKRLATGVLLAVATGGRGLDLVSMATQFLAAGYSRTDERGADKEGIRNSIEAGYNPYAMLITAHKLEDLSSKNGAKHSILSTHPAPEQRVKRALKQLEAYNIHPDVTVVDEDHSSVSEGDWTFHVNRTMGNMKAEYRAYLLAGGLWQVRQRGTVNPNYFTVRNNGSTADIYYDDIQVHRVYSQEAGAWGSANAYAGACIDMFRNWAVIANANDVAKTSDKKKKKK